MDLTLFCPPGQESVRLFEAKAAQVRQEVGEAPGAEAAQLLEALKMTIKYAVDHRDVVVKWVSGLGVEVLLLPVLDMLAC